MLTAIPLDKKRTASIAAARSRKRSARVLKLKKCWRV